MTFRVSTTKRLTAQNMYKLQTSVNGRVHGTENNACLFSIWVAERPGQREDGARVVTVRAAFGPSAEGTLLSPALASDTVGW